MDWPLRSYTLGSKAYYPCPLFKATSKDLLERERKQVSCIWPYGLCSVQETTCSYDKDTDTLDWYPREILPCDREYPSVTLFLFRRQRDVVP